MRRCDNKQKQGHTTCCLRGLPGPSGTPGIPGTNTNTVGGFLRQQLFTADGTWIPLGDESDIYVELIGGGGGGGSAGGSTSAGVGGGGGGGAFTARYFLGPFVPVPVLVGLGGAGGTSQGQSGFNGDPSDWNGGVLNANGGEGGNGVPSNTIRAVGGGSGGGATPGEYSFPGSCGSPGYIDVINGVGWPGVGGQNGQGSGNFFSVSVSVDSSGLAGVLGAGGAGGLSMTPGVRPGGNGGRGIVIVTSFG